MNIHGWRFSAAAFSVASLAFGAHGARADEGAKRVVAAPRQADVLFVQVDETHPPAAPPAPGEHRDVIILSDGPVGEGELTVQPLGELTPGKYWIGVMCMPADEALRAQLNQSEGVVVQDIVPDSPAEKSGLKKFDFIVSANGGKIGDIAALMKAVEAAGNKPLQLQVIRGGQPTDVEITPAERKTQAIPAPPVAADAPREVRRFLQRFSGDAGSPVVRFFHPGVVLPPEAAQPVPENLDVRIEKHGNEPAKIHVEQDGKTWDVTEDQLGDLPEETRGHVSRFLGRGQHLPFNIRLPEGADGEFNIQVAPPVAPSAPPVQVLPRVGPDANVRSRVRNWTQREEGGGDRLEQRLDQLNERLDRLQQLIESMQKAQSTGDAPPQP
jgi:hypothetical protein